MSIEERETQAIAAPETEPCPDCGAPLAPDQRYCLNCGQRLAAARAPYKLTRAEQQTGATPVPVSEVAPPGHRQPLVVAAGIGAFALVLGLGILIGSLAADDGGGRQVAAPPPQVITVATPAAGATAAPAEFTGDWPDGQNGYTVQLDTLSKDGTEVAQVDSAKQEAEASGASDVGALDADDFSSLDSGNYVIYAGIFDTRKQASRALKKLKKDFPDARVVKVSAGGGSISGRGDANALSGKKKEANVDKDQLKDLQKLNPEDYQKKAQKLPDTTKLPGKAPPKDEKKPGGGDGGGAVIE